jgi:DNA-binding NtrC family response regulator
MNDFKVFVVEGDPFYGEMLKYHVSMNPDYIVEKFTTGRECMNNLYKNPAVISLDYSLPDMSGLEMLKKIHEQNADIPVIIVASPGDVSTTDNLLKAGAYDYFVKDGDTKDRIRKAFKNIYERFKLRQEIDEMKDEIGKKYAFGNIIKGNSAEIRKVFNMIDRARSTNITVAVYGETGTGKGMVAKSIHYNSPRSRYPFITINISAIPRELIEREMFGYEKEAFPGATTRKIGKFEEAGKGTIFLNAIGEMDLNMQARLLRVLQEKELIRIGGHNIVKIPARIIVATRRNLAVEVEKGSFRQDLYYRLLGLPITLPPLRDRGNDILLLAKHFLDEFCDENGLQHKTIHARAQEKLLRYHFPGNVRELKAVIELAAVMANGKVIDGDDLFFSASKSEQTFELEDTLAGHTQRVINYYLTKYENNIPKVAEKLGIGKSTIYRMIKNSES